MVKSADDLSLPRSAQDGNAGLHTDMRLLIEEHNMTQDIPTRTALKAQAKALRASSNASGHPITHAMALETLAHSHGFRDWNALSAAAPEAKHQTIDQLRIGTDVHGRYLGHPFTGRILGLRQRANSRFTTVTVRFDQPIDVVASEMFSSLRKQVTMTLDANGTSPDRTSDGTPHMVLSAW